MRGGRREGAGRKKGEKSQKNIKRTEKIVADGLTPLEYMLEVLRDTEASRHERLDAAKSAAPYVHPKLAPAVVTTPDEIAEPVKVVTPQVHDASRAQS